MGKVCYTMTIHQLLTSQQQCCSHGDDGPLGGGQGGQLVEVVHSILEEERHLHVQ